MENKMKVLWFCNASFTERKITGTGTWLVAMADALAQSGKVQLYNITSGNVKTIEKVNYNGIQQWLLPRKKLKSNGLPSSNLIKEIQQIVNGINPDIIHIWGTEAYWGLLTARGYIKGTVLLEMQGLISEINKCTYSGLSLSDIINCFRLKEIIKPSVSLLGIKYRWSKSATFETEIIRQHKYISTQSDWTRAHIHYYNPHAQLFSTRIPLRKEFVGRMRWDDFECEKFTVFTAADPARSFKGLHVLIDAIGLLKTSFPEIKLVIAGYIGKGIRESGYTKFLKRRIKKLEIEDNVHWAGALNAEEIVDNLLKSNVAVIPSFIESYCLALDEPLTLGVPCVASYAGAMPELAVHNQSALYFPPGDAEICASYIKQIFVNHSLAQKLSDNSYSSKKINAEIDISRIQLKIYNSVLG